MKHRRCESDELTLLDKIKSTELVIGTTSHNNYGEVRQKTELTLPIVKSHRSDEIKKEWLTRSNRLLEIINKTSDIMADMRRYKIDKGYCKMPTVI
jgi:hypothetical protein